MKTTLSIGALFALCAACLVNTAIADDGPFASGSLLPIPDSDYRYPGFGNDTQDNETQVAPVSNEVEPIADEVVAAGDDDEFDYHAASLEATAEATLGGASQTAGQKDKGASQKDCQSCGKGKGSCDCGKTSHRRGHLGIGGNWFSPVSGVAGAKTGSGWFAYGGGLYMTRQRCDSFIITHDSNDPLVGVVDARDADMSWSGGFEVSIGKYFNCGQNAIELTYWGLFPSNEEITIRNTDVVLNLESRIDFASLEAFNADGAPPGFEPISNWVNGADTHRIRRDFSVHNIELNLLNYSGCVGYGACRQRFHVNWGLGIRYFRFKEGFDFSAKETTSGYDYDGSEEQIDYFVDVENNLLGFQVGGTGRYFLHNCLSFNIGAKLGVYGNRINHNQCVHVGGTAARVIATGETYDISSSANDVAFLGELNLGLQYQISCCWSLRAGYRAVAATGIATALDQIPVNMGDVQSAAAINSWSSLVLHGAYAGVEFNY